MSAEFDPRQNLLLAALPAADFERFQSRLKLVPLRLGEVIYQPGSRMRYAYFPTTAIVSLLNTMADGATAEVAVVGNDGILGIALFMGSETTPRRAVVQRAGHAYQVEGDALRDEFNRAGALQHALLRYTQARLTQLALTAVCNRHHTLDQQLCRWLLLILDRVSGNELFMTQESIANMLGVRREGITQAARKLQRAGSIKYSRGHIIVADRAALEARTCECYAIVKKESDRLLSDRIAS